jgi:hypothetical protein
VGTYRPTTSMSRKNNTPLVAYMIFRDAERELHALPAPGDTLPVFPVPH